MDEFQLVLENKNKVTPEPFVGIVGYYLYKNYIYVPTLPYFKVQLALKRFSELVDYELDLDNCSPMLIDMQYNDPLECHIVYCASPYHELPNINAHLCIDEYDGKEYVRQLYFILSVILTIFLAGNVASSINRLSWIFYLK